MGWLRHVWWIGILALACYTPRVRVRFGSLRTGERAHAYKLGVETWTLDNHLTVAVTPDDRVNLVSVDVRYRVGSAEDPPGKTGLAHLVEHLLFEPRAVPGGPTLSERLAVAALTNNAYTNADATHFSELGLAASLDELLGVEATRMALGCHGLDEPAFERERAVVLQELAQRGQGGLAEALPRTLFGPHHAYAHTPGGSDVARLTLADVCAFVDAYYGPDTAILVVGGRVRPAAVRDRIAALFGPIERRAHGSRAALATVAWTGARTTLHAGLDEPVAMVAYPAAPWGSAEAFQDQLIDALLTHRLRARSQRDRWMTSVESGHLGGARGGARYFAVQVDDPQRLDDAVTAIYEAAEILPSSDDDDLLVVLGAARQDELIDGFESIADRGVWCADYLQFTGDHRFQLGELSALQAIDLDGLRARAKQLAPGESHVVRVVPAKAPSGAGLAAASSQIDLPVWRADVDPAEAMSPLALPDAAPAPPVRELRLDNGLRVLMVSDFSQPVVEARMVFPVGETAQLATKRGIARVAAQLLKHNVTQEYDFRDSRILKWVLRRGARLSAEVTEHTTFGVRGFSLYADWHLWRLHWLLENGRYYSEDLERVREIVARNATHRDGSRAWRRALREALFGRDHPYTHAADTAADLSALTREDLRAFRNDYYRTAGAALIIVGNFDPEAMTSEVTELFGAWSAEPPPALPRVPAMRPAAGPTWIADADADATQLRVTYAFAATSPRATSLAARTVVAELVRARVEQIRTRLGASYGVDAGYGLSDAGDLFMVDGRIDGARGGAVLRQVEADLEGLRVGDRDRVADFVRARRTALAAALADPVRSSATADRLEAAVANHLPIDAAALPAAIAATTLDEVRAVIAQDLQPGRMVVVLSGRPADAEAALAAAGVTSFQRVSEDAR